MSEPEAVKELAEAEQCLKDFIEKNQKVYEELTALVQTRNQLLEQAEKVARAINQTCGPFVKLSQSQKIDADKLQEETGDAFTSIGGYTETVVVAKVDRKRVLALAASGDIPKEIVELCIKTEVRFSKPPVYVLP